MENKNKVIVLEQKPIISYDLVKQKGKEVSDLIISLNIDDMEPNEENQKLIKSTRSDLNKKFEVFEDQRKIVKSLIMKPYNDFDEAYKKNISGLFEDAELKLKAKSVVISDGILQIKTDRIIAYFKEVNTFDFLEFNDLYLKIIKSTSDKRLKDKIDTYLVAVKSNIEMIDTLENKDRVLVKYQMYKDLNRAISETQIEVKREADNKAQKEASDKARLEFEEKEKLKKNAAKAQDDINIEIEDHQNGTAKVEQPKIFKMSFTVTGTKEQFVELKKFMNDKGIRYE